MAPSNTEPGTITVVTCSKNTTRNNASYIEKDPEKQVTVDSMDSFNHPRKRAEIILNSCSSKTTITVKDISDKTSYPLLLPHLKDLLFLHCDKQSNLQQVNDDEKKDLQNTTEETESDYLRQTYKTIHDPNMIEFLCTAWDTWVDLGTKRDPDCFHPEFAFIQYDDDDDSEKGENNKKVTTQIPPLVPQNFPLRPRSKHCHTNYPQRPSKNVMGQMGYYCTDRVTPIVSSLRHELCMDAAIVIRACFEIIKMKDSRKERMDCIYALTTHPGHHAGYTSFGGYCYLNNAALAAECLLQSNTNSGRTFKTSTTNNNLNEKVKYGVAILDVDYHCGNGTADVFYHREDVVFVSIHCDPEFEYPFHSGHKDEVTSSSIEYIPLPPGTAWDTIKKRENDTLSSNSASTLTKSPDNTSTVDENFHEKNKFSGYKVALQYALNSILKNKLGIVITSLVISLGLDTHDGDPIAIPGAGFHLTLENYREMGKIIGHWSRENSIPVLLLQEGGYMMNKVGEIVLNILNGFVE